MPPEKPSPRQYLHLRSATYEGIKGTRVIKSMTNEKYDELSKKADQKINTANQEHADNYRLARLY